MTERERGPDLSNVARYKNRPPRRFSTRSSSSGSLRRGASVRQSAPLLRSLAVVAVIAVGALGAFHLKEPGRLDSMLTSFTGPVADALSASFSICDAGTQPAALRAREAARPGRKAPAARPAQCRPLLAQYRLARRRPVLTQAPHRHAPGPLDRRHTGLGRACPTVGRITASLVRLMHQQRESVGVDRFTKVVGRRFRRKRESVHAETRARTASSSPYR